MYSKFIVQFSYKAAFSTENPENIWKNVDLYVSYEAQKLWYFSLLPAVLVRNQFKKLGLQETQNSTTARNKCLICDKKK